MTTCCKQKIPPNSLWHPPAHVGIINSDAAIASKREPSLPISKAMSRAKPSGYVTDTMEKALGEERWARKDHNVEGAKPWSRDCALRTLDRIALRYTGLHAINYSPYSTHNSLNQELKIPVQSEEIPA